MGERQRATRLFLQSKTQGHIINQENKASASVRSHLRGLNWPLSSPCEHLICDDRGWCVLHGAKSSWGSLLRGGPLLRSAADVGESDSSWVGPRNSPFPASFRVSEAKGLSGKKAPPGTPYLVSFSQHASVFTSISCAVLLKNVFENCANATSHFHAVWWYFFI